MPPEGLIKQVLAAHNREPSLPTLTNEQGYSGNANA